MNSERAMVDEYLTKWDQFAQGDNQLAPYLRDRKIEFEQSLARLLRSNDPGAPARLVFYAVVQVGGAIPLDSELGSAAHQALGTGLTATTTQQGEGVLFCADLYAWWKKHEAELDRFPLLDDWLQRDFAQSMVLPMYNRLNSQRET